MKKLILILIFLIHSFSNAQYVWTKGELFLKNGETLHGLIKIPIVSKDVVALNGKGKLKFRLTKTDKTNKYDDSQVAKAIFKDSKGNDIVFEYVSVSKKKKFLFMIIQKGKTTLYARNVRITQSSPHYMGNGPDSPAWNHSFLTTFDEYFVLREGEAKASPLITVHRQNAFKQRAMAYFSDCPKLIAKLKSNTYRKREIIEVVKMYNECDN